MKSYFSSFQSTSKMHIYQLAVTGIFRIKINSTKFQRERMLRS